MVATTERGMEHRQQKWKWLGHKCSMGVLGKCWALTACKLYIRIKMGSNSGGADTVDLIICIERISRYMEEEHARRLGRRIMEI